ncbi:transferase family-domain-containing protein [Aspergillus floccosus]
MIDFKPYYLTALDHLLRPSYVRFVLSFQVEKAQTAIAALESGVFRLVSELPFLAGNVTNPGKCRDRSNALMIEPPSEDYLRHHPILRIQYHRGSITQIASVDGLRSSLLPIPDTASAVYPTPALRFQANIMEDGILICICWHHCFMDGLGAHVVLESLARSCRHASASTMPLPATAQQQESIRSQIEAYFLQSPATLGYNGAYGLSEYRFSGDQISCRFTLCPNRVGLLARMCNAAISKDESTPTRLTDDDVVTAAVWLCGSRGRYRASSPVGATGLKTSSLMRPVDIRRAIQPPIPRTYVGNGILFARSYCTVEDLGLDRGDIDTIHGEPRVKPATLNSLLNLACATRAACASVNAEHIRDVLSCMKAVDHWASFNMCPADIYISSLRRFPLYALDFGPDFGPVVDVDALESTLDTQCGILPARAQTPQTAWEVRIALPEKAMQYLQEDELMAWLRADVVRPSSRL